MEFGNFQSWVTVISGVVGIVISLVSTLIPLIIAVKKKKLATTEAEKQAAINDITKALEGFIAEAEKQYGDVDRVLKAQGKVGAGAEKKDSVVLKAMTYCQSKGYEYNADYINTKIDELVELTRNVNKNVK